MSNSNSPWGGGNNGGGDNKDPWGGGTNRPERPDPKNGETDIDRLLKDGQDKILRFVGGGGGKGQNGSGGGSKKGGGGSLRIIAIIVVLAVAFMGYRSVHLIQSTDNALVMRFGQHVDTWGEGPHFALWPIYTVEAQNVTEQQTEQIGTAGGDDSLMLTSDENIIDIEFEVVWRIKDLAAYQFNLEAQRSTIHAVAQSSIREVVARSPLIPLLNTDRDRVSQEVLDLIQTNLDEYNAGIDIVRVNLTKSDAPREVIKDFEDVQAAEQERDTLRSQAQATANEKLAQARGERSQLLEDAEGYRARVINEAEGEASRFLAVLEEYEKAPDVTRRRLYLETMEEVYGNIDKVIIDGDSGGQGVVPYLPLNELNQSNRQ